MLARESDCCDMDDDPGIITISFHDGGGGCFWRIDHAERWAMDTEEAIALVRWINRIVKRHCVKKKPVMWSPNLWFQIHYNKNILKQTELYI